MSDYIDETLLDELEYISPDSDFGYLDDEDLKLIEEEA